MFGKKPNTQEGGDGGVKKRVGMFTNAKNAPAGAKPAVVGLSARKPRPSSQEPQEAQDIAPTRETPRATPVDDAPMVFAFEEAPADNGESAPPYQEEAPPQQPPPQRFQKAPPQREQRQEDDSEQTAYAQQHQAQGPAPSVQREEVPEMPEQEATAPEAPPVSKNMFSRKPKKAAAPISAVTPASASAEKPNLLGKFFKKDKAAPKVAVPGANDKAAAAPSGKKSAKTSPKKGAANGPSAQSVDLLVELEGGKRVIWRVTENDTKEIEISAISRAISFSKHDYRYVTEDAVSYNQAQDIALSELGEDVRIVNQTKDLRAVFATIASRIDELKPITISPGLLAIERLLETERVPGEEFIAALMLQSKEGSPAVVVLHHYTANNDVGPLQITINPENLGFVLGQFAAARRLDVENTKVVLFKNADILRVSAQIPHFPVEPEWRGVPVRKALWTATFLVAGLSAMVALFAGTQYVQKVSGEKELVSLKSEKAKLQTEIDKTLMTSVLSFSKTQGLKFEEVSARAATFWVPGASVLVSAQTKTQTYTVVFPIKPRRETNGTMDMTSIINDEKIAPLLEFPVPTGCNKGVPEITGGLDVIKITVTCEDPAGPMSAYSLG